MYVYTVYAEATMNLSWGHGVIRDEYLILLQIDCIMVNRVASLFQISIEALSKFFIMCFL